MAHTTVHSGRAFSKSSRGMGGAKRRASSTITRAGKVHRATKSRPATAGSRQVPKASLKKLRLRRAGEALGKGTGKAANPAELKEKIGTRTQRATALSLISGKMAGQARRKQNVVKRGRPRGAGTRVSKITTRGRALRGCAAPRLFRCAACGNHVPWVSVDSRCFPCLKRGLAARKREEELALGAFDIDEDFVAAVR